MTSKYIKPNSLAWWASLAPLVGGIILALQDVAPAVAPFAHIVQQLAGPDMTAARLFQLGLLGIGLRGAMP